jgi:regulator of RNase E activity RraA
LSGNLERYVGQGVDSSSVADAADSLGHVVVVEGLRSIHSPLGSAIGRARTATVVDADEPGTGLQSFLDEASDADILVLGWRACFVGSSWGGIAAAKSRARGCRGMISGGWVRDVDDIVATGLTVWARGSIPRTATRNTAVVRIGQPTSIGGIEIADRDLVVADSTGVCVVPTRHEVAVMEIAERLVDRDARRHAAATADERFDGRIAQIK